MPFAKLFGGKKKVAATLELEQNVCLNLNIGSLTSKIRLLKLSSNSK